MEIYRAYIRLLATTESEATFVQFSSDIDVMSESNKNLLIYRISFADYIGIKQYFALLNLDHIYCLVTSEKDLIWKVF